MNNITNAFFVAIKVEDYEGKEWKSPYPNLAGRMYYLFSIGKDAHMSNLYAIPSDLRDLMDYYSHSRPSVMLATPGYNATNLTKGKELTWAFVNVIDTVVGLLEDSKQVTILHAGNKNELTAQLTLLRDGGYEAADQKATALRHDHHPMPPTSGDKQLNQKLCQP